MKPRSLLAAAAMVAGALVSLGTAGSATADVACPRLQVVGVPGTGYELVYSSPNSLPSGIDFTKPGVLIGQIAARLQPERDSGAIGYQQVAYPADIGTVMSYRKSVRVGAKATKAFMAAKAAQCPGTQFAVIGFSQGARVAGDVLHSIGQGNGPIPGARLATAGLFADPGRSSGDHLVGPPVPGIGIDRMRKGGFGAVNDKVATICAAGDIYCSADDTTLLRPLVRKFGGTALANASVLERGMRLLDRNGLDPRRWARSFGEQSMVTLLPKAVKTGYEIDRFVREGNHAHYLSHALDIDGKTSVEWMTDRLRASVP